MFASQKNHEDLVQVLLDAGADVNVKGEVSGVGAEYS